MTSEVSSVLGIEYIEDSAGVDVPSDAIRYGWFYTSDTEKSTKTSAWKSFLGTPNTSCKASDTSAILGKPLPPLPGRIPDKILPCRGRHPADANVDQSDTRIEAGRVRNQQPSSPNSVDFQFLRAMNNRKSSTTTYSFEDIVVDDISAVQFAAASAGININAINTVHQSLDTNFDTLMENNDYSATESHKMQQAACGTIMANVNSPPHEPLHASSSTTTSESESGDDHKAKRIPKSRKDLALKMDRKVKAEHAIKHTISTPVKAPHFQTSLTVQKRNVRDFLANASCHYAPDNDPSLLRPIKKPRTQEHSSIADISNLHALPSHDSETEPCIEELSADVANTTNTDPAQLSKLTSGYPGQFDSPEEGFISARKASHRPRSFVMGDPLHPHHLITHTRFFHDPDWDVLDYNEEMLDRLGPRKAS